MLVLLERRRRRRRRGRRRRRARTNVDQTYDDESTIVIGRKQY